MTGGGGLVDNGALVMDFGGGGVLTGLPISGTGSVEMKSGAVNLTGTNTYTGATTIDSGGAGSTPGIVRAAGAFDAADEGEDLFAGQTHHAVPEKARANKATAAAAVIAGRRRRGVAIGMADADRLAAASESSA